MQGLLPEGAKDQRFNSQIGELVWLCPHLQSIVKPQHLWLKSMPLAIGVSVAQIREGPAEDQRGHSLGGDIYMPAGCRMVGLQNQPQKTNADEDCPGNIKKCC